MEIFFAGESDIDIVFHLFKAHEACPVPKLQEAVGTMIIKHNRGDISITKEAQMDEAL